MLMYAHISEVKLWFTESVETKYRTLLAFLKKEHDAVAVFHIVLQFIFSHLTKNGLVKLFCE